MELGSHNTFNKLKEALVSALVLALSYFIQPFKVKTDASGGGIGVVLVRKGNPISSISKKLSHAQQAKSVYE